MEKYDVVIVGAGPGGLRCAEVLAKSKRSVLVLEKNKTIGKKICAAGVTLKAIRYGIPNSLFEKEFDRFRFYHKSRYIEIKENKIIVATLSREKLGKWQMSKVKKNGAKIIMSSRVTEVNKDNVIVNGKKIYFNHLVGADGVGSIVRRYLKLSNDKMHLCMQYLIKGEFKNLELHYNSKITKAGYTWVFPHKGYASIGCGFHPKSDDMIKVKKRFNDWCKRIGIHYEESKLESMPILYDYQGYKFGNKYLIGEAAGLAYGLTGEGIYSAMASGEDIANIILDKNYAPKFIPDILRKKRYQEIVVWLLSTRLGSILQRIGFWLMKDKKWQNWGIRLTLS
ncbi:MAG: NAD(P)/FAD-dependent oxidoreductase [Candidatus Woesearchaeota archaeon]